MKHWYTICRVALLFLELNQESQESPILNLGCLFRTSFLMQSLFILCLLASFPIQFAKPVTILTHFMENFRCHLYATPKRQSINRRVMRVALVFVICKLSSIVFIGPTTLEMLTSFLVMIYLLTKVSRQNK